jgi:hypothetical protein
LGILKRIGDPRLQAPIVGEQQQPSLSRSSRPAG